MRNLCINLFILLAIVISSVTAWALDWSHSSFNLKRLPPLHLTYNAVDLVDVARFTIDDNANVVAVTDGVIKQLGDALTQDGRFQVFKNDGIAASPISATATYSYGNFLVKVAESTGVRMLEVRIPDVEKNALAVAPEAVVAMPFRFLVLSSRMYGLRLVHICLVNPVSYAEQFGGLTPASSPYLEQARDMLLEMVAKSVPTAFYDPQVSAHKAMPPRNLASLVVLSEVEVGQGKRFANAEAVATAIKKGDLILFKGTPDEHAYQVGGSSPDYEYLKDPYVFFKGFLSFSRFSAIKDGWVMQDGKKVTVNGWAIPDKSDRMLTLVSNSVIHAYNDPYQLLRYDTAIGPIFQMQVFSGYIHPLLMNMGVWHFGSLPVSVFVLNTAANKVAVVAQNPVFLVERYMQDVSDEQLAAAKPAWNANPKNKTDWPEMTRLEMAEYILNSLQKLVTAGISYVPYTNKWPRADRLVSPKWVKETLLDGHNNGKPYLIVEAGWGPAEATGYDKGHIPGAIHVNTDVIEYDEFLPRAATPADKLGRSTTEAEDAAKGLGPWDTLPRNWWNIYPDIYLLPAIAYMGIDIDTTVVVYGSDVTGAARLIWTLMYAGVKDVRLLNGGLDAWKAAGYAVETTPVANKPKASFGATRALHPEWLATTDYIRNVVNGLITDAVIADVRTYDEYTGKTAPYSYIPTSGRIKGAKWAHAGAGPWTMEDYLNPDGTLRALAYLADIWAQQGITKDKEVSFYCGTGWRSSLAWLAAYVMGWERIKNYDGSWYYWSMGPEKALNPVIDEYPNLP